MSQTPGGGGTTTPRPPGTTPTDPMPPPPSERPAGRGGRHHAARAPEPPPVGEHGARPAAAAGGARAGGEVHGRRVPDVRQRRRQPVGVGDAAGRLPDGRRGAGRRRWRRTRRRWRGCCPPGRRPAGKRARAWPSSRTSAGAPTGARWTTQEVAAFTALFDKGPMLVPGGRRVRRRRPAGAGGDAAVAALPVSHGADDRARAACGWATTRSPPSCPTPSPAPCPTMSCSPPPPAAALAQPRAGERRRPSGCWARAASPGVTFHEELLDLRGLAGEIEKDPARFPEFKPAWRDSIAKESALFLGEIFTSGQGPDRAADRAVHLRRRQRWRRCTG